MIMWLIIMIVGLLFTAIALLYIGSRVAKFISNKNFSVKKKKDRGK